uniref:RNA helicase n=1 Tax=Esox lucius TaxID=8010 RepID=A0AAY5L7A0_ESOLU
MTMEEIRQLRCSVVTQLCQDYGMIDDAVYYTTKEVLGGVPLRVGDVVNGLAVRDSVEKNSDAWEDGGGGAMLEADSKQLRPLIGTVTSCDKDGGFINQTTFFPPNALCEGFKPMKGDWVQAQYFISPTQWSSQARSVSPLRYRRMDKVRVSSVFGSSGVVEDSVFFSLDNLLLPTGYHPSPGDLVSLVVLESNQSFYCWRALMGTRTMPEANFRNTCKMNYHYCWPTNFLSFSNYCSCNSPCYSRTIGRCAELLLLRFSSFTIGRLLEVTVVSKEESLLQPSCNRISIMLFALTSCLIKRHLPNFLGNYPVPQALRDCVEANGDVLVAKPCLGETLSMANFAPRFSSLLWLEELKAEQELREFSISGALLRRGAVYLHLEVLGLAEGRPSLFIGDRVALKKPVSRDLVMEYIGYVTEIHEEDVSLRVNSEFQQGYLGEPLDVEFSFNRLTMRRCHLALDQTRHFGDNVLFPTALVLQAPVWTGEWADGVKLSGISVDMVSKPLKCHAFIVTVVKVAVTGRPVVPVGMSVESLVIVSDSGRPIPSPGQFFNRQLNPSQREAVKRVLAGECRPTPYILFGPPGTGKTITLIESILQVYHRLPCSRVLVCTPSNSAADLICVRLHDSGFLKTASLARVNASCRQEEAIIEVLRQYSRAGEDIKQASFHRIVVSTCSSAGMFYQIGLRVGHFTHVFLDEAGQATEPEALIPLGLLSEQDGQIVLAGDPRQLGPVVKSKLAQAFGLGVSLLERLMANPLYSKNGGEYNPLLVTKLVYNYRSHEALLSLPSRLFYGGELCVRAQRAIVDSLCHWSRLPTKGFPLIFHGVRGTEMREGNNPSWFNPAEAVQVMLYCCQLAKKLYHPVAPSDIGIIAPYRKQSEKIRVLLHRVGLSDIKVGSVEEFQGREFLVIILSTVRANESVQGDDLQSTLGFLSNPKRFNVAVTRPKALLIVVGNPHVLVKDPCFHALLQYSFENGAFLGCDPPACLKASQWCAHIRHTSTPCLEF